MKKISQLVDDTDILQASMMGESNSLTPSDVQTQLQALMLEKMQAEFADEKSRKAIKRRQQESIAKEAQRKRELEIAQQKACSHKKANGTPATVGMYNHQNILMCVCQNCGKEWINNDTPQELLPDYNAIGGPGVR
jgi:DNA-directed RNA polymerase subunit M/transcription elongation factor TFIIS